MRRNPALQSRRAATSPLLVPGSNGARFLLGECSPHSIWLAAGTGERRLCRAVKCCTTRAQGLGVAADRVCWEHRQFVLARKAVIRQLESQQHVHAQSALQPSIAVRRSGHGADDRKVRAFLSWPLRECDAQSCATLGRVRQRPRSLWLKSQSSTSLEHLSPAPAPHHRRQAQGCSIHATSAVRQSFMRGPANPEQPMFQTPSPTPLRAAPAAMPHRAAMTKANRPPTPQASTPPNGELRWLGPAAQTSQVTGASSRRPPTSQPRRTPVDPVVGAGRAFLACNRTTNPGRGPTGRRNGQQDTAGRIAIPMRPCLLFHL